MEHYLPQASSYAGDIDGLVRLVTYFVGFWFILAEIVFFFFILKFRERKGLSPAQYISGEEKKHTRWISVPHALVLLCDIVIIVAAVQVWYHVKQHLEPAQETVRVTAQQWAWVFQHAGPDGQLDTKDDIRLVNEMHLQEGVVYNYELVSRDVLHSFSVPAFRLKHDAIPGRVVKGWFKTIKGGTFDIQCAEICGIGHALMPARLYIETPEAHAAWLAHPSVIASN
jgi:cytochrome c oxidase subunit 2